MLDSKISQLVLGNQFKFISNRTYRNGYLWEVEKIRNEFEVCPKCAHRSATRAGRCTVLVREAPLGESPLWLKIHKHRYMCKHCRKPFTEPVSIVWPRRRTTQRFRKVVARACENMTDLQRVRQLYSVSTGFLYEVFYSQIQTKLRERQSGFRWPTVVGIDEHFFRRQKWGSEFVTVFTDLNKHKLFEVARGKDVRTVMEQVAQIPGREDVRLVVIDMSKTYKALVKILFPNAKIVADKFHVLRLLTPTLMKLGKQIHGHRQELKTRRLLLKSRINLDYELRSDVDRYLMAHPELNEVYRWKEKLFEVYRIKGFVRATKAYSKMLVRMKESGLEPIQKLARTLQAWKNEILLHFENGLTNAFTEQTNNTGKLVQKRAYGYKSFKNYRLRLLSACLYSGCAL